MRRLEQFGMVAFQMSPPSSPQGEQFSQQKVEQHTPHPLSIEDPLQPPSVHGNYKTVTIFTWHILLTAHFTEFKPPPVLSPPPAPKVELSPKPPTSKPKSGKGKGGGGRKKKGDGHSNAPKKPSNAFFWFCQEHRGSLQDQFRGEGVAGQHDLTKILAKLWSEATAEDKKVCCILMNSFQELERAHVFNFVQQYYHKYEEDKRRYDREMKAFVASEQQKASMSTPSDTAAATRT